MMMIVIVRILWILAVAMWMVDGGDNDSDGDDGFKIGVDFICSDVDGGSDDDDRGDGDVEGGVCGDWKVVMMVV